MIIHVREYVYNIQKKVNEHNTYKLTYAHSFISG